MILLQIFRLHLAQSIHKSWRLETKELDLDITPDTPTPFPSRIEGEESALVAEYKYLGLIIL